ncbi:MAG: hypothetical protein ABIH41_06015 [Nanoarchaeota archaeon]
MAEKIQPLAFVFLVVGLLVLAFSFLPTFQHVLRPMMVLGGISMGLSVAMIGRVPRHRTLSRVLLAAMIIIAVVVVIVNPRKASAAEETTWGSLKQLYGGNESSGDFTKDESRTLTVLSVPVPEAQQALYDIVDHDGIVFRDVTVGRVGSIYLVGGTRDDGAEVGYAVTVQGEIVAQLRSVGGIIYDVRTGRAVFNDRFTPDGVGWQEYFQELRSYSCAGIAAYVGAKCVEATGGNPYLIGLCGIVTVAVGFVCENMENIEQAQDPSDAVWDAFDRWTSSEHVLLSESVSCAYCRR